jgi:hypothetical protein
MLWVPNFVVKLVFKVFHNHREMFLIDKWVKVRDIAHSLNFVRYCLFYGCLG